MRREKRWRYYCDYCSKSGASGGHMKRHEKGCTNNPNRECGMCRETGLNQAPMPDLLKAIGDCDKEGLAAISDLAEGCPACILSAIRQRKDILNRGLCPGDDEWVFVDWDYRAAKEEFWADVNDASHSGAW